MTETTTKRSNGSSDTGKAKADLDSTTSQLSSAAATAASVAQDVARNASTTAQASLQGLDGALKRLETEPDQTLTIGAAFSLGVSAGLLLAGGPRLLALATAAPGIAMALTLLQRAETTTVSA